MNIHRDQNLVSGHGRSNFEGLVLLLRNLKKMMARVAPGCVLLQSGLQFEYLTNGVVQAGDHWVIITQRVARKIVQLVGNGRYPWRVTSTLFGHIRPDYLLQPLAHFRTPGWRSNYPPILVGDFVNNEIAATGLDYGRRASASGRTHVYAPDACG